MKLISTKIEWISAITIGLLSVLCCLSVVLQYDNPVLFAGPLESTMDVFGPNLILCVSLTICCIIQVILSKMYSRTFLLGAVITFGVMVFFGRTVGIHYSGLVELGWFYVPTQRIELFRQPSDTSQWSPGNPFTSSSFVQSGPLSMSIGGPNDTTDLFVDPFTARDVLAFVDRLRRYD